MAKICQTKLPTETLPLLMYSGEVTLSTAGSKLTQVTLLSHENIGNVVETKKLEEIFENHVKCRRSLFILSVLKFINYHRESDAKILYLQTDLSMLGMLALN